MWWLADKMRLARELGQLTELSEEGWLDIGDWSLDGVDLQAALSIKTPGADYALRLVFPAFFPNVPAWVAPADSEQRLSTHQFGPGGSLCLELGPDNWTPAMTGADMLRSAHKLLATENPLGSSIKGEVENGHRTAQFQTGIEMFSVFVDWGVLERLKAGPIFDPKALRWMPAGQAWPAFLSDQRSRTEGTVPPSPTFLDTFFDLPVFQTTRSPPDGDITRAALIDAGDFAFDARDALRTAQRALLIFGVGDDPKAYLFQNETSARAVDWLPLGAEQGVRSGAPTERAKGRVAIVGAGSVGSKLAETLARSGARNFMLVDGDILLPDNLERNALDWRDVGARKVDSVKARLLYVAPQVAVATEANSLRWQTSSRVHAATMAAIGRCDVIVDATGDPGSSLMLGALAASAKKPFVSVEVLEGGIGVLVAACLPNRDPSYGQARANFLGWCAEQGGALEPRNPVRYGGSDDDGAPIVADDTAVTIAAGHAARVILDILDGQITSKSRAWQLIGLRDAWVFKALGPYVGIDVGAPDDPPVQADPQTEAFVRERLKDLFDAIAPAS